LVLSYLCLVVFSSGRRHTRSKRDWSSDVCSSDLITDPEPPSNVMKQTANIGRFLIQPFALGRNFSCGLCHIFAVSDPWSRVHPEIGRAACREIATHAAAAGDRLRNLLYRPSSGRE